MFFNICVQYEASFFYSLITLLLLSPIIRLSFLPSLSPLHALTILEICIELHSFDCCKLSDPIAYSQQQLSPKLNIRTS